MSRHQRYALVGEYQMVRITSSGTLVPVGAGVNTTSGTTISAGNSIVVTPVSMSNIVPGMLLNVANGTGAPEDVRVKAITATTFTADFKNGHSGAYTILSRRGAFVGRVMVNNAGSAATLTLYNGSPSVLPDPGAPFAVIPLTGATQIVYDCAVDKGLLYTITGSGFDMTLTYLDQV